MSFFGALLGGRHRDCSSRCQYVFEMIEKETRYPSKIRYYVFQVFEDLTVNGG